MNKRISMPKVTSVEVLPPYGLRLAFEDQRHRDVDMTDQLWGTMFEPLKDSAFFAQVTVEHGTLIWPNGLDLDPLVLHGDFESAAPTQNHQPS